MPRRLDPQWLRSLQRHSYFKFPCLFSQDASSPHFSLRPCIAEKRRVIAFPSRRKQVGQLAHHSDESDPHAANATYRKPAGLTVRKLRPVSLAKTKVATAYSRAGTPGSNLVDRRSAAYYLPSDLIVCAEGAARVDWISCARSRSTLVFSTVPPKPRIAPNITSMSPSWSKTKMADVPGFISSFTSLTKSSPIPAEAKTATEPAPPTMAPMVAPVIGAPSTKPAIKPTTLQPTTLDATGNSSRFNVNDPSGCRTTTATSSSMR